MTGRRAIVASSQYGHLFEIMTEVDEPHKRSEADLREEAREWFVRRLQKLKPSDEAEFQDWLANPAHDRVFRHIEAVWQSTEMPGKRLASQEAEELAVYLRAIDRNKTQRRTFRRLAVVSVVLIAVLAGGTWWERPHLLQNMMADFATDRGERRLIRLSDGSTILLDADSALDQRFSHTERRVTLLRGKAFFDIAHESRPFIASAAEGEIRDIGTTFDVSIVGDRTAVTLESGKVDVSIDGNIRSIMLEPGQRVRFGRHGTEAIENVELDDALAWRSGRYIFYRARLSDVVAEISRYRRGRIVIANSSLGDELVTGSFLLVDTDAALSSLQASVGFQITSLTRALTIISP